MTKYKEYFRANDIKLEEDYPCMPFEDLDSVVPFCTDTTVGVKYNYYMGSVTMVMNRAGIMEVSFDV